MPQDKKKGNKNDQDTVNTIWELEAWNKVAPNRSLTIELQKARAKLRDVLLYQYESNSRKFWMVYYSLNNKAGSFMARRLKDRSQRRRIPWIEDNQPTIDGKSVSEYYSSLYNLRNDNATFQPGQVAIDSFLQKLSLPCLNAQQCIDLGSPFSASEINEVINIYQLIKVQEWMVFLSNITNILKSHSSRGGSSKGNARVNNQNNS